MITTTDMLARLRNDQEAFCAHLGDHFRLTWRVMASLGLVDELDGQEYRRVEEEWVWDGCPARIVQYILRRAEGTRKNVTSAAASSATFVGDQPEVLRENQE